MGRIASAIEAIGQSYPARFFSEVCTLIGLMVVSAFVAAIVIVVAQDATPSEWQAAKNQYTDLADRLCSTGQFKATGNPSPAPPEFEASYYTCLTQKLVEAERYRAEAGR